MPDHITKLVDTIGNARMAIVIGRTDSGKSTIIKQLAGHIAASIVDGDIGQSDIGPPTVVSLAENVDGSFRMVDGYFCGSTTPSGHLLPLIAGMVRMAHVAKKHPILINTTGLATGNIGRSLVTEFIDALRPDVIIGISNSDELKYLDAFGQQSARIIHLPISPHVKEKTKNERERYRRLAFKKHFEGATSQIFQIENFSVERSLLFNGMEHDLTEIPGILHAETSGLETIVVREDVNVNVQAIMERLNTSTIDIYTNFDFAGVLVGLVGPTGQFLGLGIIEAIDFIGRTIRLFTTIKNFSVLQFGSIRLSVEDYSYIGPFRPKTYRA